jgi:metallophosphoesterase (TIGR00282 family)
MKILFIGDIFGKAGRDTVKKILPDIKAEHSPDFVIANCENLTHGNGFSPEHIEEMTACGIDYFTSGNHVWGNSHGVMSLGNPKFPVLRPANYPSKDTPGRGYAVLETGMMDKILIVSLMGLVFMKNNLDCPFKTIDRILQENSHERFSAIIVDLHAETTSEKYAFGFYVDGRVSAVLGTHTHVSTTDARIFENGTAYISDVGMVGAYDSVIGVKKDLIVNKFLTQMPVKHVPESFGKMVFSAVLLDIDDKSKKALDIIQIQKFI